MEGRENLISKLSKSKAGTEVRKTLNVCLLSATVFGFLAHSFMLFNKISWHDDFRHTFDVGATYKSGRWALGLLGSLVKNVFGMNISIPVINGVVSLLFIALSAFLIIYRFEVKQRLPQMIITSIMICFPVVTATFGYMFTAPYYFFALLTSILGGYLITEALNVFLDGQRQKHTSGESDKNTRSFVFHENSALIKAIINASSGILLIALTMGIYQPYLVCAICFIFFFFFYRLMDDNTDCYLWIRTCVISVAAVGIALVLYLLLNKIFLFLNAEEMGTYQGLNSMTQFSIHNIKIGIIRSYNSFYFMFVNGYKGLFYLKSTQIVLLIMCLASTTYIVLFILKTKSLLRKFLLILLILASPLMIQLIELFSSNGSGESIVHTLMTYSLVYLFVFPLCFLQNNNIKLSGRLFSGIKILITCCSIFFVIYFCIYNNAAYFKSWIYREQAEQFYNRLITRVESEDGYRPGMTIALVGKFDASTYVQYRELEKINIKNYPVNSLINNNDPVTRNLRAFFYYYNDFPAVVMTSTESEKYGELQEVKLMSCYPSDGSIEIIDNVLVVKLSDISK